MITRKKIYTVWDKNNWTKKNFYKIRLTLLVLMISCHNFLRRDVR
jgi:hypothetical protein